ncbi:MAG: hypothetical protein HYY22_01600 [Thaumarchaeota archaeon]|nr:hypothetical protein [Nitrososphaerota archaeon]
MRASTLTLIFFLLLIPDILFVLYFAAAPAATAAFLRTSASGLLPSYLASNLVAIIVLTAFLYAAIVASALFYFVASPVIRRIIG